MSDSTVPTATTGQEKQEDKTQDDITKRIGELKSDYDKLRKKVDSICMFKSIGVEIVVLMSFIASVLVVFINSNTWVDKFMQIKTTTQLDLAAFAIIILAGVTVLGLLGHFILKWFELRS